MTDDLGRSVRFASVPKRIVSLAPSLTETVFAVGADSLLVGVTSLCNYPPRADDLPEVGDLLHPDVERILALDPDLVLISVEGNTHAVFEQLNRVGLQLFVSNPRTLDGICKSVRDIGGITGRDSVARRVVDSLHAVADTLRSQQTAQPPSLLMLVGTQPIMAAGGGSFLDEIIALGGAKNAAKATPGNYPVLNREEVLRMNPDMLLYPDDMHLNMRDLLQRFPEWRRLSAVSGKRLHPVDADIFLRPGPRAYLAAWQLHQLIARDGE